MTGQRLANGYDEALSIPNGAYWVDWQGRWSVKTPNGRIGALDDHSVIEHEDGTITVSPSIATRRPPDGYYHGYLERGEWREC